MSQQFHVRQQEDQLSRGKVVAVAAAGVIITVVSVLVAWWYMELRVVGPLNAEPHAPPPPELGRVEQSRIDTTQRGIHLQQLQQRELQDWGWVDRQAGIARIPIDEAMRMVAR